MDASGISDMADRAAGTYLPGSICDYFMVYCTLIYSDARYGKSKI